nr:HAD family phosphatase [Cellulomonas sp. URHD0024]
MWSDFGGVLTPPIDESLAVFCAKHRIEQKDLFAAMAVVCGRYGVSDPLEPLDTPMVSEKDWLRQVSAELDGALDRLDTLADVWFDDRPTNTVWVDALLDARRAGVKVGMLSNMVPTWDAHWRRMVDVDELFDQVVLSFEVGRRKPDREMFELAARRAGVRPGECVLVDDLAKNCAGAQAADWRAIHFTDSQSAPVEGGARGSHPIACRRGRASWRHGERGRAGPRRDGPDTGARALREFRSPWGTNGTTRQSA